MAQQFSYVIDDDVRKRNPTAIFKLRFGTTRYFLYKGLRVDRTVQSLAEQIQREKPRQKEDSILFKVVAFINRHRIEMMKVEVIREIDDPVELLMAEYEALQAAKDDPNCLNTRFTNNEHFPKWIPQTAINEFNKRLQGVKPTDKDKNLKRFLSRHIKGTEAKQKIFDYIKTHYR